MVLNDILASWNTKKDGPVTSVNWSLRTSHKVTAVTTLLKLVVLSNPPSFLLSRTRTKPPLLSEPKLAQERKSLQLLPRLLAVVSLTNMTNSLWVIVSMYDNFNSKVPQRWWSPLPKTPTLSKPAQNLSMARMLVSKSSNVSWRTPLLNANGSRDHKKSTLPTSGRICLKGLFFNDNFSILKYETVANGANRKLIVKNIRRQDVGEYSAKSGESKVTVKLTVGAQSASGSALTGKYFILYQWRFYVMDEFLTSSWRYHNDVIFGFLQTNVALIKSIIFFILFYNFDFATLDWQNVRDSWQGVLWQTQMNIPSWSPFEYQQIYYSLTV